MKSWKKLAAQLQKEEAIMGYRNTPENLKLLYDQGLATVKFLDRRIIAYSALWPTTDPVWFEMGSFWVHPNYRGKKLLSEIVMKLFGQIPENKKIFAITHSVIAVMHVLKKNGLNEIMAEDWNVCVPFFVTCQPCDLENKTNCNLKGTECLLFA